MDKPLIGIDMDGVICRPPFGLNVPIAPGPYESRPLNSKRRDTPSGIGLMAMKLLLKLKYYGRRPLEDAREGIESISEFRTPVLVTSRNGLGVGLDRGVVESAWISPPVPRNPLEQPGLAIPRLQVAYVLGARD